MHGRALRQAAQQPVAGQRGEPSRSEQRLPGQTARPGFDRALEGYDIEKLYVERESLEARGLSEDDLIVDVTVLSSGELGRLMDEQDVVLSF